MAEVAARAAGLIALTGGPAGPVNRLLAMEHLGGRSRQA